ncbi:MAG TPA: protein TolQ [Gammaproteobacteria bacterium]|nr:protein TolQ [Pseudomonadota bacterium]HEX2237907.1 protein TolQ [Gammaproteobacteria bacterium]
MQVDLSVYHLIGGASLLVQLVMVLLLAASIASWTMIVSKWKIIKNAREAADKFEDRFWSGTDLAKLYDQVRSREDLSGMEHIFVSGFREYVRLHRQNRLSTMSIADTAQRSMKVALSREVDSLEHYMSFLATVGSTSPYVGLFGTVWGIMNSFLGLGNVHQATLSAVAPGIAEALIATAMGLFAAIPAVIAYNHYSNDVERLVNRYDNFVEEFTALLQRQVLAREESAA